MAIVVYINRLRSKDIGESLSPCETIPPFGLVESALRRRKLAGHA